MIVGHNQPGLPTSGLPGRRQVLRSAVLESRLPADYGAIMSATAYTEIANHDRSRLAVMNERLASHSLCLDDDTAVALACRPAWKALMQRLGISNAW
jgi:hypothetical protein